MLRTQILMKTAEIQLSRPKEQAVILQKSILLNRKAQFEPGHQKYLAIEKQMDAEDLFEHAAQVYVEAIELDLQGANKIWRIYSQWAWKPGSKHRRLR